MNPRCFNQDVAGTIQYAADCEVERGTERSALSALVKRIAVTDRDLALEVEAAANALAGAYTDAAFALGWECAKHPERLIFEQE